MSEFNDCCMGTSKSCLTNGVCDWLADQLAPSEGRVSWDDPSLAMHQSLMMKGASDERDLIVSWLIGQAAAWRAAGDLRLEMIVKMLAADIRQEAHRE